MADIYFVIFNAYGLGGTVRTTVETANALADAGASVEIISLFKTAAKPAYRLSDGVTVRPLTVSRLTNRTGQAWASLGRLKRFLARVPSVLVPRSDAAYYHFSLLSDLKLIHWYTRIRSGCVVGTRLGLNMALARIPHHRVRLCLQEHTHLGSHPEPIRNRIRQAYRKATSIVTLTESDAEAYRALFGDGGPDIAVVPNSVPGLDYRQSDLTNRKILCVARLAPEKGVDLLISAFQAVVARHPDWTLEIVGTGECHAELEAQIYRLGLYNSVFLRGSASDVVEHYAQATIYVQPSRYEGFGIALLEAMSSGVPVVAFDCPVGPREIVTDGVDGVLVPPENVAALSEAMLRLVEDQAARARLAAAGRGSVDRFSPEANFARWCAVLGWS